MSRFENSFWASSQSSAKSLPLPRFATLPGRMSDIRRRLLRVRLTARSDEISPEGVVACATTMTPKVPLN